MQILFFVLFESDYSAQQEISSGGQKYKMHSATYYCRGRLCTNQYHSRTANTFFLFYTAFVPHNFRWIKYDTQFVNSSVAFIRMLLRFEITVE